MDVWLASSNRSLGDFPSVSQVIKSSRLSTKKVCLLSLVVESLLDFRVLYAGARVSPGIVGILLSIRT